MHKRFRAESYQYMFEHTPYGYEHMGLWIDIFTYEKPERVAEN